MRFSAFSSKTGTALQVAVLAGMFSVAAVAQSGVKTDAQVEANVLRALAGAPELSTQNVQSTTTYGVVTLTGTVENEALRTKAENLAARADGVKKVVDQMTLGEPTVASESAPADPNAGQSTDPNAGQMAAGQVAQNDGGPQCQLLSDGTCAPPDQGQQQANDQAPPPPNDNGNTTEPSQPANQAQGNYPPPPPRRSMYPAQPYTGPGVGQQAGLPVTVPAGAVLNIRINRGLVTGHVQPGTKFDATVLTDVVAGGAVAIPRGAAVQGTVVAEEKAGALKGRGELSLQLTGMTLGGQQYALVTDTWTRTGQDKTAHTVNSAILGGAVGALFGAVVGGGRGAAVGAGVGGGLGVANSAASPSGQVIVPPESVLTFKLAQPAQVATVSQGELQRLAYTVAPPPPPRRYRYPAGYYYPYGYYGR